MTDAVAVRVTMWFYFVQRGRGLTAEQQARVNAEADANIAATVTAVWSNDPSIYMYSWGASSTRCVALWLLAWCLYLWLWLWLNA